MDNIRSPVSQINRFDKSAGGKVVGDDNVATQRDALARENRLDSVQLFAEAKRDITSGALMDRSPTPTRTTSSK